MAGCEPCGSESTAANEVAAGRPGRWSSRQVPLQRQSRAAKTSRNMSVSPVASRQEAAPPPLWHKDAATSRSPAHGLLCCMPLPVLRRHTRNNGKWPARKRLNKYCTAASNGKSCSTSHGTRQMEALKCSGPSLWRCVCAMPVMSKAGPSTCRSA
eukprot:CAMPEP_0176135398 /NCGR_PEP_ID=MMETSP0120_2-20121206/68686_1 /TAXON_ID=160619 /ORGANISM="Kryptoperidinium foliaceum, Strain CCMP 1326" /LENGTH=154 /DNA_ID=CAMNT_0017471105 /DNA_START=510 /DNA_END=971 /DNA_ORIENTATION=+